MTLIRPAATALLLTLGLLSPATARQNAGTADERALVAIVDAWSKARSDNDAAAMTPLFAEKVDRVNLPKGLVESTTRDELIAYFAKGFAGSARGTHVKTLKVRPVLLSDTVGLMDHTYTMYNADGSVVGVGHTTFTALKTNGTWKVVAVRYASAWPSGQAAGDASTSR